MHDTTLGFGNDLLRHNEDICMSQPDSVFAKRLDHQTREVIAFTNFRKPDQRQELN
jgi:hypothetical protein